MAIAPNNPPNQVTIPNAATPTQLVVDGAFVSALNPIPTTTGGATTSTVTTNYICINPFVDANGSVALNDQLINLQIFNSLGAIVTSVWTDVTASFTLDAPPPAGDVEIYIPGGGATAANQTLQITEATDTNTTLTAISGQIPATLGQKASAASLSTVLASDATLPLPTGAATAANQATEIASLATIETNSTSLVGQLPAALGLQLPADSLSVVVANGVSGDLTFDSNYTAILTFTGANQGDVLSRYVVLDPSTTVPTVVSETWYNLNQQTTLAGIPTTSQVVPVVGSNLNTTATYYAISANPGSYAINDVIQQDVIVNPVSVPPAILSTTYNNLTTGAQNISVVLSDLLPTDSPTAQASSDAPVTALYAANTANVGIGYAVGDTIQKIEIINPLTAVVVSTTWVNLTTGATLGTPPVLAELTASQSQLPPSLGIQTAGNSLSVYVANQATNTSFPVTSQFVVSTAFALPAPGGALGDLIQELQVYDTSVSPAVITTTVWSNLTTNVVYATPVSFSDLTSVTSTALTDAELRAAPVPVFSNTETTFMYTVTTGFTGATVGDILARVITFQATSTVPTQLDETWYNLATGLTLAAAPDYADVTASASSTVTPSLPSVTASITVETGAGTTAAGATSVSFANNGAANATVAGAILPPTASLDFTANAGSSINAIAFDGTGTSLLVAVLA